MLHSFILFCFLSVFCVFYYRGLLSEKNLDDDDRHFQASWASCTAHGSLLVFDVVQYTKLATCQLYELTLNIRIWYRISLCTSQSHTFDIESDIVRAVEMRRLGADLAVVETVVCGTNILYDEAPFARSLVVIDANPRVADECKQTDRQRVDVVMTTPRDLQHVTWHCYVFPVTWPECRPPSSAYVKFNDTRQSHWIFALSNGSGLESRIRKQFVNHVIP